MTLAIFAAPPSLCLAAYLEVLEPSELCWDFWYQWHIYLRSIYTHYYLNF